MRGYPRILAVAIGASGLAAAGCAAKRPVLYPNAAYQQAGEERAHADVEECLALAKGAIHGGGAVGRAGAQTAGGAAVGSAAGAAAGAVLGNAARGAATGAAAGGAGSLVRGLFRWRDPDPIEQRFVQECLRERGYRVIGWN